MIETFLTAYEERKEELKEFIEVMEFFEKKEKSRIESGQSEFDQFFHGIDGIGFSYQQLINILKSNASLMVYSIIEFTVSNLVQSIYDEIKVQGLSYLEVSESIRKIWREALLKKAANDPNASFNTFLKKHEAIIQDILCCKILQVTSRQTLPGGNLDGEAIKHTFAAHGIKIYTGSENFRPDLLESIKNSRNNLAHGSVSFVEAMSQNGIDDIKKTAVKVLLFLDELVDLVKEYIKTQQYKTEEKSY